MSSEYDDLSLEEVLPLAQGPLEELLLFSESLTVGSFGPLVTYSRKVFIPLTKLCRDVCHYCT
ncbi:hypothetical protein, partial [Sphingobium mellinum]|uniref:hypothetical protein n=1 Tax=Sphingobium mellinum TaxID=1387166 RepID=UPI0030EDD7E7